jgi:hypothetical protein
VTATAAIIRPPGHSGGSAVVAALDDDANPLALSAYEVHGEIVMRTVSVVLFTLVDIVSLTPGRLGTLQTVVRSLVGVQPILLAEREHLWYGRTITSFLLQVHALLTDQFEQLSRRSDALGAARAALRLDIVVAP